jgi:hypothetical protein
MLVFTFILNALIQKIGIPTCPMVDVISGVPPIKQSKHLLTPKFLNLKIDYLFWTNQIKNKK